MRKMIGKKSRYLYIDLKLEIQEMKLTEGFSLH